MKQTTKDRQNKAIQIHLTVFGHINSWEAIKPGDQTGHEIEYGPYYNFQTGWKFVLRYGDETGTAYAFEATLKSTAGTITWSTGAGPKTRNLPYIELTQTQIGFKPNVICVIQQGEILANTMWIRGASSHIYVANYENNAYAGVAVGQQVTYFNPDAEDLRIPVHFPNASYVVRIFG